MKHRKLISLLLVLCALLSVVYMPAMADEEAAAAEETEITEQTTVEEPAEQPDTGSRDEEPAAAEAEQADAETLEAEEQPAQAEESAESEEQPAEETAEAEQEDEISSEEPEASEEPEEEFPAWVEPGNTDMEILSGGTYLQADSGWYFSEGGIWYQSGDYQKFICGDDAMNLNLSGGWLYYTVGASVYRVSPSGGTAETVYVFDASISELYVMGSELRFLSGGTVYSYDMDTEQLRTMPGPAGAVGLIPTEYGNLLLTGSVFDYTLWAGEISLMSGIERCYTDCGWLVVVKNGETCQAAIEPMFEGSITLQEYTMYDAQTAALANDGLTEEEHLAAEYAYVQSDAYQMMQDGLNYSVDGYYTATNSKIAYTAQKSGNLDTNQTNIVKRGRQMAELVWTPVKWRYSWGGNDSSYVSSHSSWGSKVTATDGSNTYGYFAAGKSYQGVPYAQAVYTGYVGWNISIDGFVAAVNNSSSSFYSGYSTYSRTAPYYGTDCSGFVSWAWNLNYRCTCTSLLSYSKYISPSISNLRVGDSLNNPNSHVVLITDIAYDSSGNVVSIEITEETPPKMRVTCYGELIPGKTYQYTGTLAYVTSYYLNGGYSIYRRNVSYGVGFTEYSSINLDENGYAEAPTIKVAVSEDGNAMVATLSHKVSGAKIYYTVDGSTPTKNSMLYTGPIEVTTATTIKAIADCGSSYTGSYTLTYEIDCEKAETPFAALVSGDFQDNYVSKGTVITVLNENNDTIYYTTDGSDPTVKSSVMSEGGITITKDTVLRCVAKNDDTILSDVVEISLKIGTFHVITSDYGTGGYISPSGEVAVLNGSSYTFNIIAGSYYNLEDVLVDGVSVGKVTSYTFKNVTSEHTIYAKFKVDMPFTDVSTSNWFYDSVLFVYTSGLFKGVSSTQFSPNSNMTRGMFITALGRFAGGGQWTDLESWSGYLGITRAGYIAIRDITNTSDVSVIVGRTGVTGSHVSVLSKVSSGLDGAVWYKATYGGVTGYMRKINTDSAAATLIDVYDGAFTDIPDGKYYTGYAQWANIEGIMNGVTSTTFCPDSNITRQDICVLMYRYLTEYLGLDLTSSGTKFTDDSSIASYAKTAVYAMRAAGIVNGYTDGSFHPNYYATRAEVATMFKNLHDYLYSDGG